MTTSANIALLSRQELEKLSREHVDLKVGDRLKGEVTEVRDDGKAVVDFGKFQAALELKAPVQKGDVISVVVVETGKQIKLKLEQIESQQKIPADVQKAISQAEAQQARTASEIKLPVREEPPVRDRLEPPTEKNRADFFKGERLPPDLKEALVKLKQILQASENTDIKSLSGEIKNILETLQAYGEALDPVEKIARPAEQLVQTIRSGETGVPVDKEVQEILTKITDAVDRLVKLEKLDQLPEIKRIIEKELKPDLQQLKEIIDREIDRADPASQRSLEDVKKAVDDLLKNMEKALEKLPDKVVPRQQPPQSPEIDNMVKQLSDLRSMVENSPTLPAKEMLEIVDRLSEAAEKISRVNTPDQLPEIKTIIANEIKPGLLELKQVVDGVVSRAEPAQQRAAVEIKQAVDNTLQTLEKLERTLEKLPENLKSSEHIDTLLKEIKNIRETLEARSETLELGNKIVKQVSGIKTLVENYRLPSNDAQRNLVQTQGLEMPPSFEREVEVLVARLSEAAGKIAQIKSPDQLPELKSIIETELKPDLSALKEIIEKNAPPPEQVPERVETGEPRDTREARQELEARQAVEGVKERVEYLQREIEITLAKLPENDRWSEDTRELLKDIESALGKISEFSFTAGQGAPLEDIETLFENIKIALRQLRVNINTGHQPLELPPEFKNIFANLQLNFNSADMEKAVTQQVAQLNALIEILENSGFAADKRVEAIMAKLTEIVNKLGEIKNSTAPDKWQQLFQTLQQDLSPTLKALKQVFTPRESVQNDVIRDRMFTIFDAAEKLEQQVGRFIEKNTVEKNPLPEVFTESTGKTGDIPKEAGEIFAGLPRSLQTPENLARLVENIRGLGPGSLPEEIKPFLSMIRSHFEPLDIGQDAMKLVPKLKSMVEDSGIFFEKKLQDVVTRLSEASDRIGTIDNLNRLPEIRNIIREDLKPNLLQLRELLNDERLSAELGPKEVVETLKKSVESLLENINSQQGRAVESQTQQQPVMVFSFNLPIKGQEDAQLKVFYNRGKKREEEGEFKLSLLLNMNKLGDIRTDFSQFEKNLNITFFVKSYKIKEYIEDNLDEIREPLEPEFKAVNLKVMVSEEQIAAFDMETAVPGIITDKEVDVKV